MDHSTESSDWEFQRPAKLSYDRTLPPRQSHTGCGDARGQRAEFQRLVGADPAPPSPETNKKHVAVAFAYLPSIVSWIYTSRDGRGTRDSDGIPTRRLRSSSLLSCARSGTCRSRITRCRSPVLFSYEGPVIFAPYLRMRSVAPPLTPIVFLWEANSSSTVSCEHSDVLYWFTDQIDPEISLDFRRGVFFLILQFNDMSVIDMMYVQYSRWAITNET